MVRLMRAARFGALAAGALLLVAMVAAVGCGGADAPEAGEGGAQVEEPQAGPAAAEGVGDEISDESEPPSGDEGEGGEGAQAETAPAGAETATVAVELAAGPRVRVVEVASGEEVAVVETVFPGAWPDVRVQGWLERAIWSPTESRLLVGDSSGLRSIDVESGEESVAYAGTVHGWDWSPDGSRVYIGTEGLRVVDPAGRQVDSFYVAPMGGVAVGYILLSPSGERGLYFGSSHRLDGKTVAEVGWRYVPAGQTLWAWLPDDRYVSWSGDEGITRVNVFEPDAPTDRPSVSAVFRGGWVALDPMGAYFVHEGVADADAEPDPTDAVTVTAVVSLETGKRIAQFARPWSGPYAVSPDGSRFALLADACGEGGIALATPAGSVAVLDLPTEATGEVWTFAWAPDGRRLAYVLDGRLWVVEVAEGSAEVADRRVVAEGVDQFVIRWSADGRYVAVSDVVEVLERCGD